MATKDPFNHAVNTANTWLVDICDALGTTDRQLAHRSLRAWLHCLRDRLTVDSGAKFGAQLPELVRGMFYDGWTPARVPIRYEVNGYLQRFTAESGVSIAQAPAMLAAITGVVSARTSPGQVEHALAALPAGLRATLTGTGQTPAAATRTRQTPDGDRLDRVEGQISDLTEAVRVLAHSMEDGRLAGVDPTDISRAARLADEILIGSSHKP